MEPIIKLPAKETILGNRFSTYAFNGLDAIMTHKVIYFFELISLMGYSVEQSIPHVLHPVRDASLTGCKTGLYGFSTERCIPNGMLFALTAVRQAIDGMPENKLIINTFIY